MEEHYLIVSNPPHSPRGIAEVAELMGLTPAEFRVKANYPVPEVWYADSDRARVDAFAGSLRGAGLNVATIPGSDLAELPAPEPVRGFQFGDEALGLRLDERAIDLPYGSNPIVVYYQSRAPTAPPESRVVRGSLGSRLSHADVLGSSAKRPSVIERASRRPTGASLAFVDIYADPGGAVRRFALVEGVVDFSELPSPIPRGANSIAMFVAECSGRFSRAHVDRRLVGMRSREPLEGGGEVKALAMRKGFSFGTRSLQSLLKSIEAPLEELSHSELASRLIYLTWRAQQ